MPGTAVRTRVNFGRTSSHADMARVINQLITVVDGICIKLDNDAGVTDTNYTALWSTATPIADLNGTTINGSW